VPIELSQQITAERERPAYTTGHILFIHDVLDYNPQLDNYQRAKKTCISTRRGRLSGCGTIVDFHDGFDVKPQHIQAYSELKL
jgi:hypothetical protein